MSVVGIDFGNRNGVVAVARRGGIDVVDNEASNRTTPTMVVFGERQRLAGEAAAMNFLRNVRSSVAGVKRLLGARWGDPAIAKELARQTCPVVELPLNGDNAEDTGSRIGLKLNPAGEPLTPEQAAAIVLGNLKQHAERATQSTVRDVVISVPGWWGERQRRAMLDAAAIAGLNVLRLLNEHTAAALAYGIYKTDLHETEPRRGLFIDIGHSSTTASVTAFVKGKLTVQSIAFDTELGGRDFDEIIANALADEATKKLGADPRNNQRAWQRLLAAAEKQVKRVISAGTPCANVAIDNLANDRDFSTFVTKERFGEIVAPLLDRITPPIQRALDAAGIKPTDLAFVECLGGGMRLPHVQERISALLGRTLDKTLNMEEVIARGCALMCAMLSPVFRVRDFKVEDLTPYPIRIYWKTVGDEAQMDDTDSAILIQKNNLLPAPKMISFARSQPIEFVARYEEPTAVPCAGPDGWIGTYRIEKIPPASLPGKTPKLKVKARLTPDGTFVIDEAEVFDTVEETVEIEEPIAPTPTPATAPATGSTSPPPQQPAPATASPQEASFTTPAPMPTPAGCTDSPNPMPCTPEPAATSPPPPSTAAPSSPPQPAATTATEPAASPATPAPAASPAKRKRTEVRKKTVHKALPVTVRGMGLSRATLQRFIEEEGKMAAADKLAIETSDAKNQLESFQYSMRDKLSGELGNYGVQAEVAQLIADLEAVRDWLYGDGEDQTKGVYVEKLKALQKRTEPLVRRKTEADARPAAIAALEQALQQMAALAQSQDEKYEHIDTAERAKVTARVGEVLAWLTEQKSAQAALPMHADPVLTVAMLTAKRAETLAFCESIMNRPKPLPPPKPASPPAPAATAAPAQAAPAADADMPQPPPEPTAQPAATATAPPGAAPAPAQPAAAETKPAPEHMDVDSSK